MAAKDKPVTVTHPTFDDTTETVPASEVDQWVAAGWVVPKKSSTDD